MNLRDFLEHAARIASALSKLHQSGSLHLDIRPANIATDPETGDVSLLGSLGAARAERSLAEMTRADASQRALEASRTATQLTESALGDAEELVQKARENLLAAGNPSYSDGERNMLVQSLKGIRAQLLSVANRADGAGNFLFGGQGSSSPPFVDAPGGGRGAGLPRRRGAIGGGRAAAPGYGRAVGRGDRGQQRCVCRGHRQQRRRL